MLRVARELDIFRKLPREHREAAAQGGSRPGDAVALALRCVTAIVIAVLFLQEALSFAYPARRQHFDLDMSETAAALGPRKVRVVLDITVHDFACEELSLDYQDVMGTRAVDVRSGIFKERLDKQGQKLGTEKNDPKALAGSAASNPSVRANGSNNASCGSCYGARPLGECCNTCSDVMYAYRLKRWSVPRVEEISQCQHDRSSNTGYQPPQILRLDDYSADDFMPKFTRIGDELSRSGSEARVSTPFRFNFSLPPLQPLRWTNHNFRSSSLNSSRYGFQPLTALNFSTWSFDDDYGFDYFAPRRRQWSSGSTTTTTQLTLWPDCIWRNLMIHGWRDRKRLEANLTRFGVSSGCFQNNCLRSDVFDSETLEKCSAVCYDVPECTWWTWGVEDDIKKCWLRNGRSGREKRFGFASGHRHCASPDLIRNESNMSEEELLHNDQTHELMSENNTYGDYEYHEDDDYDYGYDYHDGEHPRSDAQPATPKTRRLSSYDEDDFGYRGGSRLHMPLFGHGSGYEQQRLKSKDESCRVHGHFDINKVPGNFHIGSHGPAAPSFMYGYGYEQRETRNMQHTINHLVFLEVNESGFTGDTSPLDGFGGSPKAFTFQYYIMLSPATKADYKGRKTKGYQFRAGSFVTNELIGPAVYFRLDIDPIRVTYYFESDSWSKFVVNLCAIVGGGIALSSMLEQLIETAIDFLL